MRRRQPAPHGFAVNDDNLNFDKVILLCRICCPLPRHCGNHTGRLAVYKPFTGSLRVLPITTQSRPPHLTCGQTILCIMIPRSRSWRKGKLLPRSGQKVSLETNSTDFHHKRHLVCGLSWRFFRVARLGGNVPAWLVCIFQASDERFFISRSSYSPEKRELRDNKFKKSKFLFKTTNSLSYSTFC